MKGEFHIHMKLILNKKDRHINVLIKENERLLDENTYLKSMLEYADVDNVNQKLEETKKVKEEYRQAMKEAKEAKKEYEKLTREFALHMAQVEKDLKALHK